jgi:Chalcone isomerase-like
MKNIFSKFVLAALFSALTLMAAFSAQAVEIKGVKVDETAQVGGNALVLNGAGVRTKMVFKVYVAALYLAQKTSDATAVLSDTGSKRVSMHFLRELSAEKLLHAMDEGFEANNSAAEMTTVEPQMKAFRAMMTSAKAVKEGDVILLDYAGQNTTVNLNGKALGSVEGAAFNQALLRVWLGKEPVDASLKKAMLGQ